MDSFSYVRVDGRCEPRPAAAVGTPEDGPSGSRNEQRWPVLTLAPGADDAVARKDVDCSEPRQVSKLPACPPWYQPGWQP